MNPRVAKIYIAIVEELKHAKVLNNLDIDLISITVFNTKLKFKSQKLICCSEKIMSKPSRQSLTAILKRVFSGGKNAGKILNFNYGMKFKGLSLSPAYINLLPKKSFIVEDISRLLKIQVIY